MGEGMTSRILVCIQYQTYNPGVVFKHINLIAIAGHQKLLEIYISKSAQQRKIIVRIIANKS